jgi:hypothetical protein
LDTLFIGEPEVAAIRAEVAERYGLPGARVMASATHNHAGPAVTDAGEVAQDAAYAAWLVDGVVGAFGRALADRRPAEVAFGRCFEWEVGHNRRVLLRDGTARTHGTFDDPNALCFEGPIDPEVAVIALREPEGALRAVLVNFACHPTHHGGDTCLSAGYPGALAEALRERGCPLTLFLNGAAGNVHTANPRFGGKGLSHQEAGQRLAADVWGVLPALEWHRDLRLTAATRTLALPYCAVSAEEAGGRVSGAQRFVDPAIYDRTIPALLERIAREKTRPAEIQVLGLGETAIVGVPGELFCEFGLALKQRAYPVRALVSSCTNGRVGYIPTLEAFRHGGYETTFGPGSFLAPEAGDLIVDAAAGLIGEAGVGTE